MIRSLYSKIKTSSILKFNFLFLIIYISGLYFSKDYGITWDEDWARVKNGKQNLAYILKTLHLDNYINVPKDIPELNVRNVGAYGAFFDVISVTIEQVFSITDKGEIFKMRHKLNFTFYFLGVYLYFLFSKRIFSSKYLAFIGSMFYLLSPRLLAHGCFNPRDSIAQSLVACSLLPLLMSYQTLSKRWTIIAGLILGIGITTRLPVMYLPVLFIFLMLSKGIPQSNSNSRFYELMKISILFLFSVIVSVFIFWPFLWKSPLINFKYIWNSLAFHPWDGDIHFLGQIIKGNNLPWYYIPIWIAVTIPIQYLFFIFISPLIFTKNKAKNKAIINFSVFMWCGFVIPIIIIISLKSIIYDGWRHLFFLYPFLAYFMTIGFEQSYQYFTKIIRLRAGQIILLLSLFTFSGPLYTIINMHPHQQVYYNSLAGKDPMKLFEGDYWGSSMRQGVEWILNNDDSEQITIISPETCRAIWSWRFLNEYDQSRANYIMKKLDVDLDKYSGDYFVTNFRGDWQDYKKLKLESFAPYTNEVFSINVNNMKIISVYKLNTRNVP